MERQKVFQLFALFFSIWSLRREFARISASELVSPRTSPRPSRPIDNVFAVIRKITRNPPAPVNAIRRPLCENLRALCAALLLAHFAFVMWDLKLLLLDIYLNLYVLARIVLFHLADYIDYFSQIGFSPVTTKLISTFPTNMTLIFSIKFFFCIAFLILIRGGTPRYRYDYLTKLGWLKFLSLVLLIFFASLLTLFAF